MGENPSLYQFTSSAMSNFNHTGLTLLVCLALNRCGRHLPSKLGIWLGVFVGSVIVIVLNELDSLMIMRLWAGVRSNTPSALTVSSLVPGAFRRCTIESNIYPCSVRAGTFVALFMVRVYIVLSAAM